MVKWLETHLFFYALEIKGAVFSISAFSSTLVQSMFYLAHNVHM